MGELNGKDLALAAVLLIISIAMLGVAIFGGGRLYGLW
jgi:hypothetical protein